MTKNLGTDIVPENENPSEVDVLKEMMQQAFNTFNRKSLALTNAYNELKGEVARINLELERKNQELSLKNKALDEAKDFLSNLFEGMVNGIIVIDKDNRVIKINRALCDILKISPEHILEKKISEKTWGPLYRFIKTSRKCEKKRNFDACKLEVNGETLWLELSGSFLNSRPSFSSAWEEIETSETGLHEPEKTQKKQLNGNKDAAFLIVVKDLTEVRELRQQLIQNAALVNLGQMAVTVAHEIRNPLGGIEGFAALLKRDLNNPEHIRLLDKIINGVQNLNSFISDLLKFSKTLNVRVSDFLLMPVIEKAVLYSGKDTDYDRFPDIKLLYNVKVKELKIKSDPDLIQQVILNLLINAYQQLSEGGTVEIEIGKSYQMQGIFSTEASIKTVKSIHYDESRSHTFIAVKDSGPGIDPEIMDKIFHPFFTTKAFGTGIGLAMVHKIIELLEGKIELFSHCHSGGAGFYIFLPDLAI